MPGRRAKAIYKITYPNGKIFNDDWLADYGFLTVQADLLVGEVAAHVRAVAAVVLDDGKPRGVITRQDVLGFLAAR